MTEHIKMPDIMPIVRYVADGTTTVFAYPFPIFASEDLTVSLNGARQISGFTIAGAGQTSGGTVTFDDAPTADTVVTLSRELPLERLTDFLEGGDFSAQSINTELDFLMACTQQVNSDNEARLRYDAHESPANNILPNRADRANKALGFDGDGNPVAVSLEGAMAAPDFTAQGTGAAVRSSSDKLSDFISVKDFGAKGDGTTNDTIAIQNALAAHDTVMLPAGTYVISGTISLGTRKSLIGAGARSVLKCTNNSFVAVEIPGQQTVLSNLRIEGGLVGVKLFGKDSECTQNAVTDVQIIGADTGIQLDGYNDTNKPCYWNNFARVLVEQPLTNGVHLTKSGAGDTPNANKFHCVRVYSKGAATSGSGFYVEHGALNNSFTDCEANINGLTAEACFRVGAGSNKILLMNFLAESSNLVPNVQLDSGSLDTAIINLSAQSDGAAILDNSDGNYEAINAGWPEKYRLKRSVISDLKATLMRYDTEYIDSTGTQIIDLSHSVHFVNAVNGAITTQLPAADSCAGVVMTIKKVDTGPNIVSITETNGNGPDGRTLQLGGAYDYATMISNGAAWHVIASNRLAGNTRYFDGSGTYDIDMAVDTYLLSSFGGTLTARLPPANASEAIGRTITIKKTDPSSNVVNVSEQGGSGPDQYTQPLNSQYSAITVVSDGGKWFIISKF